MLLDKIKKHLRLRTNDAAFALGLRDGQATLRGFGARILTYHGIDRVGRRDLNGRFVSETVFEAHLRYLSARANVISLDDFFAQKFDNQCFNVAITFDDGYRNNLELALPLLEKYGLPATFFITPAHLIGQDALWMDVLDVATAIGPQQLTIQGVAYFKKKWRHTRFYADANGQKLVDKARFGNPQFAAAMMAELRTMGTPEQWAKWAEYWQLLDGQQIKNFSAAPLVRMGAHGLVHQDLARATPDALQHELEHAKRLLEQCTGQPVHQLAYPFGAYSPAVVECARAVGYTQQYAIDPIGANYHDVRERMVINPYISANNLWLAIKNGRY
jgi:peptidoglycan/xylan/chitin deacetylase (PgdA/CDA1 family)